MPFNELEITLPFWEDRASTGRCTLGEGATAKPSADIKPNVVRQAVEPLARASGLYCWAGISVLRKYEPEARASGLSAQRPTLKIHSLRGRVMEPSLSGIPPKRLTLHLSGSKNTSSVFLFLFRLRKSLWFGVEILFLFPANVAVKDRAIRLIAVHRNRGLVPAVDKVIVSLAHLV